MAGDDHEVTAATTPRRAVRFPDLPSAGRELVSLLEPYRDREDVVILAMVRGGFPAAVEVARAIGLPLDVVLRRTALHVGPARSAAGFTVAGTTVLDPELRDLDRSTPEGMNAGSLLDLLQQRTSTCRGVRPPLPITGKTVLLVDNGVRTGDTLLTSIRAIRTLAPARVVVAVGAASVEARQLLEAAADEVICLLWPETPFGHVGLWYQRLDVPSDEEIGELLAAFP